MHVLVVTVVHTPGDARILHRQIRALRDAGHEVTYVAPWRATATVPPPDVRAVDVPRAAGRARLAALRAARRRLRALSGRADIVLLHDPELLLVAGASRAPVVWDVHEDTVAALGDKPWLPAALRPALRALVAGAERLAERRLHLLLAEERYAERFRRPHPVVPNEAVVPAEVPPSGDDRVVYVGRVSRGRGAEELVALARLLPPGVRLELIGPADAEVAPALRAAADTGVLTWQEFLPNDEALRRVEGSLAGLSLLRDEPNYRHSRPTKVVEYLSRGVPVITTPSPLAVEIVEAHGCGVVVPFRDPAAVAEAVRRLQDDAGARQAMADRGHAAALAHYDWRTSGRRFTDHLERWAATGN